MTNHQLPPLSRRERQIMDIIYERGQATAVEVHERLPDAPSYSAVRGLLRVLEDKGVLTHTRVGKRNLYIPNVTKRKAGRTALKNLVNTFFSGSPEEAVATLIDMSKKDLSEENYARIKSAIQKAEGEGR